MNTWLILAAAGSASRMNCKKNKIFLNISHKTVLEHSIDAFYTRVEGIVIAIRQEDKQEVEQIIQKNAYENIFLAIGGSSRQESVANALKVLPSCAELVMIHDAARPFISPKLIREIECAAYKYGACIPAIQIHDTIKRLNNNSLEDVDRSNLYAIQTPQAFLIKHIKNALAYAFENNINATDESSLMKYIGITPHIVKGEAKNIKLTTKADLQSTLPKTYVGYGFDVHQLVKNRNLILCGVQIEHCLGLLGHSDADVACHALSDAILGAAAMYDIGRHFPDTDNSFKNANSIKLLENVIQMVYSAGFSITNADICIAAQRPKLLPYIDKMRMNIANALNIDISCVNVKATTTEKLGYIGREEGIAAMAVVSLTK